MKEIIFLTPHTLKENRKSYQKGDIQKVSPSIAKRLIDAGIAKLKTNTPKRAKK